MDEEKKITDTKETEKKNVEKKPEEKKARFTRVFNPQHASSASRGGLGKKRPDGARPAKDGQKNGARPAKEAQRDGARPVKDGQKPVRRDGKAASSGNDGRRPIIKPRPESERPIIKPRPESERPIKIKQSEPEPEIKVTEPVQAAAEAPVKEIPVVEKASEKEVPVQPETPKAEEPAKQEVFREEIPAKEEKKEEAPEKKADSEASASEKKTENAEKKERRLRQDGDRTNSRERQDGERNGNRSHQDGDRPHQDGDRQFNRNRQDGERNGNRSRQDADRPRQDRDKQFNRSRQDGERSFNRNRQDGDRQFNRNRQDGERNGNRSRQDGDRPRQDGERSFNRGLRQDGNRSGFGGNGNGFAGNRNGAGFGKDENDGKKDFRGARTGSGRRNDRKDGGAEFKEETAFRQEKEDRKNRKERNRQEVEREERSIHQEKTIKGGVVKRQVQEKPEEEIKSIIIPEVLTLQELASKMKMQPSVLIKKLFLQGQILTLNSELDYETAENIAMDYDIICEKEVKVDAIEELLKEEEEDESLMTKRPPVVCVMGHVDHGKTSLLDAIRSTNVTAREAGGITQHIGASVVECNGQKITFLDTPGHEAFTAMRMRGAQSTDIAILVVAADDGVMPQTIEAINHAKAAGVSIIVAINKIDKPGANVERVKQELTEYGLVTEDWGGSTICVPVSAKSGEGISDLLEMVLLQADILELKANASRKARGLVIEAKLDKGKGSVATMLVQKGTLRVGDIIAVGSCFGKVRAMLDDKGNSVKEAGPSAPVELLGLNGVPNAGDIFVQCYNEKEARAFAETYIKDSKEKLLEGTKSRMSLDDLFSQIQAGDVKELNLIVKADVQGSVEAVRQSLTRLSNEEVVVKVIHGGVGAINESDVSLASASNAIIIGFNVKPDNQAKDLADQEKVDLRLYKVIYNAIDDIEAAMKGMLDPIYEEKVIGHAEIRQLFKASGIGTIAGSYVLDGIVQRGCKCRISREGEQLFDGDLASLKRFKDDVKEVKAGFECGLVFDKFNDIKEGDQVEAYIMQEVPR